MGQGLLWQRPQGVVQIRYLDGHRLRRAVLAGINRLNERSEQLNNINVYPVPDADTGTNMSATMRSAGEGLRRHVHRSIESVSQKMAESAIMGSQGNSGAILAQFLRGLADGLKGKARASTREFAAAVDRARLSAYAALAKPREGTILTIMKDWAEDLTGRSRECDDFAVLLSGALVSAKESLRRTPDMLAVLKEHGVVDAGALGFVHLLEGITEYMEAGQLRSPSADEEADLAFEPRDTVVFVHRKELLTFRFCTECIVRTKEDVTRERVEALLESQGDSLVVVGGAGLCKVHIHTNEPLRFYETMAAFGPILKRKCDDMQAQHEDAAEREPVQVAIVTDSACDLPMDEIRRHFISIVPLKVLFGEEAFLDKVEISPAEFLRKCRTSPHHPKTSQPSVADFLAAYERAAKHSREIVAVCLSGGVSGTYQAAVTAAAAFDKVPVHVVDSRIVGPAQGLLVREAQAMADAGAGGAAIAARLESLRAKQKFFICLKSLTFAHRGGRVSIGKSMVARFLNIKPILVFTPEGKTASAGAAFGWRGVQRKIVSLAKAEIKRAGKCRVAVAHIDAPEVAQGFAKRLRPLLGDEAILSIEVTPVLGSHAGPGAAGIAILPLD